MNNQPLSIITSGIFYLAAIALTFFSMFSVYILLRYGQNRALSFAISILYTVFYLVLLWRSYTILQFLR